MKFIKKLVQTILIIVGLLAIGGMFLVNKQTNKSETKYATNQTEITNVETTQTAQTQITKVEKLPNTEAAKIVEGTVTEILNAYATNEIAADEVLKGKMVLLTGEIKSIEKVFGGGVIYLKGTNDFNAARCYLKNSEMKKAAKLLPNTTVKIIGEFDGLNLGAPVMKKCEIK